MGFQSGINQALGAVAGAAYAAKSNQEKITNTKLDLDFSMAELAQAEAHAAESGNALSEAKKETADKQEAFNKSLLKNPGGKGNTKAKIDEMQAKALDDLDAAKRAENVLNKKHFANEAMVNRFKNRVSVLQDRLNKLGGIK